MSYDTENRLSVAMKGLVGDRPYAPDLDEIESRGLALRRRRLAWRVVAGGGFAVAAVAAVAVATSGAGVQAPAPTLADPRPATAGTAEGSPLVRLVGYLSTAAAPAGDATLVLRKQVFQNGSEVDVWDLYADNGDAYFAKTRDGLPAQVKGNHLQSDAAGRRKVVAAATFAAKGDLNEARERMAFAYVPAHPKITPSLEAPGVSPSLSAGDLAKLKTIKGSSAATNITDNWVWHNSVEALTAGAGSPAVRAGVLRLMGQMPEVKVAKGVLGGRPVLTLAAGSPATYRTETVTISADNGVPIRFAVSGGTINYTVTRVSIADVADGRF